MDNEIYTTAELIAAAENVFKEYKPYLVAAALKSEGGECFTLAQARKIVAKFANKKA